MQLTGEQGAIAHYMMVVRMRHYSPHTIDRYKYALEVMSRLLESLCGVTELERVTVLHLRQCVQHLMTTPIEVQKSRRPPTNGKTLAASSICALIRGWKVFFNWCQREELIDKNPAAKLEFPKIEKKLRPTFSDEQVQAMFDMFDLSTECGFRDYVILVLLIDTGLRRFEVAGLCVDDVQADYIKVFGKGRKERQVGISPELSNLLWKYIHKYRHPRNADEKTLFLSTGTKNYGLPFGRGGMGHLMLRVKDATGIADVRLSAHTFRHTFARMYLDAGGDVFSLSREMGHENIKTTQRYLEDFSSENARKRHNEFSPLKRFKMRTQRKGKGAKGKRKNDA